jgi:hypothetical protein
MANNLEKILDILSKAATVQQISNTQQPQSIQKSSNTTDTPGSAEPNKYIYISMEDLAAIFPGLADKLDITKILSALTNKAGISKILSSLGGNINIKPVENNPKDPEEASKND